MLESIRSVGAVLWVGPVASSSTGLQVCVYCDPNRVHISKTCATCSCVTKGGIVGVWQRWTGKIVDFKHGKGKRGEREWTEEEEEGRWSWLQMGFHVQVYQKNKWSWYMRVSVWVQVFLVNYQTACVCVCVFMIFQSIPLPSTANCAGHSGFLF